MKSITASIIVTFVCMTNVAFAYNCSNVITIESRGLLNYLANVTFPAPRALINSDWNLELETDVEYTFLGGWAVWIQSKPAQGKATFRSRNDDITLNEGDTVTFRFRISWFTDEPVPEVISLIWEDEQLCLSNGESVEATKARRRRSHDEELRKRSGTTRRRRMRLPVN